MKVKVKTKDRSLSMPVPMALIGLVIRLLPEKVFDEMKETTPEPYQALVSKESIIMILREALDVLKENRGLEFVHVETSDGTFVSITL